MNGNQPVEQSEKTSRVLGGIGCKAAIRFGVYLLLFPMVLFVAAGRLDWVMGWVYVGLLIVFSVASRLLVLRRHPDLLAERARSLEAENVKGWDRLMVGLVALYGPLATWIVAGLDQRYGWMPQTPFILQLVALAAAVLGYAIATWAMVVNRFFSAYVRIQKDRDQTVVTDGPYRFVRHPSYAVGILSYLATPFMLDALWALVPAVLVTVGLIVRTALEDRTLQAELDGYANYAQRVRYRLLPGVW